MNRQNAHVTWMIFPVWVAVCAFGVVSADDVPIDAKKADVKKTKTEKIYVAVFDFVTIGKAHGNSQVLKDQTYGAQLADSVRLKLRKQAKHWEVIDRLTMAELSGDLGLKTKPATVREILSETLGAHIGVYGQVQKIGDIVRAEISCIDLRKTGDRILWTKVFSDDSQRARAVISNQIVEAVTGDKLWKPPEYGDETEPTQKQLGKPLNINGRFENGHKGWDAPDGVSTFVEAGPKDRGKILRVRTDLKRDPWLEYRKGLRTGKASRNNPPEIEADTSFGCVGGLEGVHFRSEWIKATPGGRYWLTADVMMKSADTKGTVFPKVFVKGFRKTPHALDGLAESSLAELRLTPEEFAKLPKTKREEMIRSDAQKHPKRYLRECYRWYLACRGTKGQWTHADAPFPPRGGLPADVEWLQIQIYSYWPPGQYQWDNVLLYKDPNQKAPLKEVKPRTKNFGKTSDVVEKQTKKSPHWRQIRGSEKILAFLWLIF